MDLSEHAVQVRLGFEEYGGKTRLKVQFLNPYGSTGGGGVTKADGTTRKSIANRLGSKLRAVAGPAPAAAPKAASAAPKLPPAKPKQTPPPAKPTTESAPPAEATMEQAWDEFVKHCDPAKWDQQAVEAEWFRILAELVPGKQPDQLSPTEWAAMRDQAPGKIIPF